jgi:SAM-dependent methyltransferase
VGRDAIDRISTTSVLAMNKVKMESTPTKRFSERARYYDKYRPGYPKGIIDLMRSECGLTSSSVIADIGSGTGILSEMFLRNGNIVFAVEPNEEMRKVAEDLLDEYPNFKSVNGTAESTTLESHSVDFITVGHAFHWFNLGKTKPEFLRILKPGGWVVIIWNNRRTSTTPFLIAFENLLRSYGTDYKKVDPVYFDYQSLSGFFGENGCSMKQFENFQVFDFEGLKGRLLSMSFAPMEGHPNYEPMMDELERMFCRHQKDGKVIFEYDTRVYFGQMD